MASSSETASMLLPVKKPQGAHKISQCPDKKNSGPSRWKVCSVDSTSGGSPHVPIFSKSPVVTYTFKPHASGQESSKPTNSNHDAKCNSSNSVISEQPQARPFGPSPAGVWISTVEHSNVLGNHTAPGHSETKKRQNLHTRPSQERNNTRGAAIYHDHSIQNPLISIPNTAQSTPPRQVIVQPNRHISYSSSVQNRQASVPTSRATASWHPDSQHYQLPNITFQDLPIATGQNSYSPQLTIQPDGLPVYSPSFNIGHVSKSFTHTPHSRQADFHRHHEQLSFAQNPQLVYLPTMNDIQGMTLTPQQPSARAEMQNFCQPKPMPQFERKTSHTSTNQEQTSGSQRVIKTYEHCSVLSDERQRHVSSTRAQKMFARQPTPAVTISGGSKSCAHAHDKPIHYHIANSPCYVIQETPRFTFQRTDESPLNSINNQDLINALAQQQIPPRVVVAKHCLPVLPISGPWPYDRNPTTARVQNSRPLPSKMQTATTATQSEVTYANECVNLNDNLPNDTNSPVTHSEADCEVLSKETGIFARSDNILPNSPNLIYAEPSASEVSVQEFYLSSPESLAPETIEDWDKLDIVKGSKSLTEDDIQTQSVVQTIADKPILDINIQADICVNSAVSENNVSEEENVNIRTSTFTEGNQPEIEGRNSTPADNSNSSCLAIDNNKPVHETNISKRSVEESSKSESKDIKSKPTRKLPRKGRKGKRRRCKESPLNSTVSPANKKRRKEKNTHLSKTTELDKTSGPTSNTSQNSADNENDKRKQEQEQTSNHQTLSPQIGVNMAKDNTAAECCPRPDSQELSGRLSSGDNTVTDDQLNTSETNLSDYNRFLMSPQDLEISASNYQPDSVNEEENVNDCIESESVVDPINSNISQSDSTASLSDLLNVIDSTLQAIRMSTEQIYSTRNILGNLTEQNDTFKKDDRFLSGLSSILDIGCRMNSNMINSLELFVNRCKLPQAGVVSSEENLNIPCLTQESPLDLRLADEREGECFVDDVEENQPPELIPETQSSVDEQIIVAHYSGNPEKLARNAIRPCSVNIRRLSSAEIAAKMANLVSNSWSVLNSVESCDLPLAKKGSERSSGIFLDSSCASAEVLVSDTDNTSALDENNIISKKKKSLKSSECSDKPPRRSSSRVTRRSEGLSEQASGTKQVSLPDKESHPEAKTDGKINEGTQIKASIQISTQGRSELNLTSGDEPTPNVGTPLPSDINSCNNREAENELYHGMRTRGRASNSPTNKKENSDASHNSAIEDLFNISKKRINTSNLPTTTNSVSQLKPAQSNTETLNKRNFPRRVSLDSVTQKLWERKSLLAGVGRTSEPERTGPVDTAIAAVESTSRAESTLSHTSACSDSFKADVPFEENQEHVSLHQCPERNTKLTSDDYEENYTKIYGERYSKLSPDTSLSSDDASLLTLSDKHGRKTKGDENKKSERSVACSKGSKSQSVRYKQMLALEGAHLTSKGKGTLNETPRKKHHSDKRKRRHATTRAHSPFRSDSFGSDSDLSLLKSKQIPTRGEARTGCPGRSTSDEIIAPRKRRGLSNEERQGCFKVFDRVYNLSWSEPFRVEIQRKQVPDYFRVIKTPMYFRLIACKLRQGQYTSVEEFVNDMRLVFYNCRLYHQPNPLQISAKLLEAANVVEKYLNKELRKTFPNADFTGITGTPYSPDIPNQYESRNRKRKHSTVKTT